MKPSEYIEILKSNVVLDKEKATTIEEITNEYPYFQSARAVYIKYLHDSGSFRYNPNLKRTAAHTIDRAVLFDYITSTDFQGINNIQPIWIEEPVREISIESETTIPLYVCDVLELFPIIAQVTPDLFALKITPQLASAKADKEELPAYVFDLERDLPIVSQVTLSVLTTYPKIVITLPEAEELPIYIYDLERDLPIVSQVTLSVLTTYPQIVIALPEPEVLPIYVFDLERDLPIALQVTTDLLEVSLNRNIAPVLVSIEKEIEPFVWTISVPLALIQLTEKQAIVTVEEKLEIGKPLSFSKTETHSFQEWLQLTAMRPIVREKIETPSVSEEVNVEEVEIQKEEKEEEKIHKQDLINRFIESNPRMPRANTPSEPKAQASNLVERPKNDSTLMTETLAKVYLEQKKYDRAIQAYEILILKNPEKSSLFADRIEDIKKLKHNNSQN